MLEELAVEMRGQDDSARGSWVLGSDNIGHFLPPQRRVCHELVLHYVPIQSFHSVHNVIADEGVVLGVSCTTVKFLNA